MNRQSIASLIIGILAVLAGLYTFSFLKARRCTGAGGTWDGVRRACTLPEGLAPSTAAPEPSAYLIALLVGVAVGFMLWRLFQLSQGGGPRARG